MVFRSNVYYYFTQLCITTVVYNNVIICRIYYSYVKHVYNKEIQGVAYQCITYFYHCGHLKFFFRFYTICQSEKFIAQHILCSNSSLNMLMMLFKCGRACGQYKFLAYVAGNY